MLAYLLQLHIVIAAANAILVHAVQYDFTGATILGLANPVDCIEICGDGPARVPGVLINAVGAILLTAVHTQDHALRAEAPGQIADQTR